MIVTGAQARRVCALVDRLQRLLAERQEILIRERDARRPSAGSGWQSARLAELTAETNEVLDSLAELIPPEFPVPESRSTSVA